jgi:hypothetical protein
MSITTTVRVDAETHALLSELSDAEGWSLIQTIRAAADALKRERIGRDTARRIAELQADPAAWTSYLAEGGSTEVADGIG